jgi:Domain of unknown function (DUF4382)
MLTDLNLACARKRRIPIFGSRLLSLLSLLTLSIATSGCAADVAVGSSGLRVYVADAPQRTVQMRLVIDDVALLPTTAPPSFGKNRSVEMPTSATPATWQTLTTLGSSPVTLNEGSTASRTVIASAAIPAGSYSAIRLHVVTASALIDGGFRPLSVGDGYVEAKHLFAYRGTGVTELVMDLNGELPTQAMGEYRYAPVLTVKSEDRY